MKTSYKLFILLVVFVILVTGCAQTTAPKTNEPSNSNSNAQNPTSISTVNEATKAPVSTSVEPSGPKYGGTLVVATKLEPKSYVVNYVWEGATPYINHNILSKLIGLDSYTQQYYGDLAESWTNTNDLMQYTLKLKRGIKWHDGKPFTSADVKWTIDSIVQMGDKAAAFKVLRSVESVETPDDYTVILKLKSPDGVIIQNLASYNGFHILPKHLYEGTDPLTNPYNTKPIGTGPFKFIEHVIGSHTTLEAYQDYHGVGPYLDKVVFTFVPSETTAMTSLEAGEIGMMTASPAFAEVKRLDALDNIAVDMTGSSIVMWMGMNAERKYMSDPLVRQAIFYAVNREDLVQKLYFNLVKPAESFYTTRIEWADNKTVRQPDFDLNKANELLDQAGYKRDANGKRFELVYRAFPTSIWGTPEQAQMVVQYLAEVGIDVKLELAEFALRNEKLIKQRDWDLCSGGGNRGPDPSNFASFVASYSTSNMMKYANPEIDQLFEEGKKSADPSVRAKSYFKIQEILSRDLPMLNFIEYSYARPYNTDYSGFFWQESAGGMSDDHMVNAVQWSGGKTK